MNWLKNIEVYKPLGESQFIRAKIYKCPQILIWSFILCNIIPFNEFTFNFYMCSHAQISKINNLMLQDFILLHFNVCGHTFTFQDLNCSILAFRNRLFGGKIKKILLKTDSEYVQITARCKHMFWDVVGAFLSCELSYQWEMHHVQHDPSTRRKLVFPPLPTCFTDSVSIFLNYFI